MKEEKRVDVGIGNQYSLLEWGSILQGSEDSTLGWMI